MNLAALSGSQTKAPGFAGGYLLLTTNLAHAADRGFSIGGGPSITRYDSNFKITSKETGRHIFVDTEGSLSLPSTAGSPILLGSYRFSRKHGIAFGYYDTRRQNTLLDTELELGGGYVVSGDTRISDESNFYNFNYSYALFQDERAFILFSAGLFGLDLGLKLEASGEIRNGDELIDQSTINRKLAVFAPLPLFGLDFWYAYTEQWGIGTRVSVVAGAFDGVHAGVFDTVIRARYRLSEHFDLLTGLRFFSADVNMDDQDYEYEVSYRTDGVFFGLNYRL